MKHKIKLDKLRTTISPPQAQSSNRKIALPQISIIN